MALKINTKSVNIDFASLVRQAEPDRDPKRPTYEFSRRIFKEDEQAKTGIYDPDFNP